MYQRKRYTASGRRKGAGAGIEHQAAETSATDDCGNDADSRIAGGGTDESASTYHRSKMFSVLLSGVVGSVAEADVGREVRVGDDSVAQQRDMELFEQERLNEEEVEDLKQQQAATPGDDATAQ